MVGGAILASWLLAILIAVCCSVYRKQKACDYVVERGEELVENTRKNLTNYKKNLSLMMT